MAPFAAKKSLDSAEMVPDSSTRNTQKLARFTRNEYLEALAKEVGMRRTYYKGAILTQTLLVITGL